MANTLLKKIFTSLFPGSERLRTQASFSKIKPYSGPRNPGVDTTTLQGKVMCGYQGWFAAEGDDSGCGWVHFGRLKQFRPGYCAIDFWPDMSEMSDDEKFSTPFKHLDGRTAHIFSSYNHKTVLRHFQWMKEYGLDGVFLQRFVSNMKQHDALHEHRNIVMANVQAGANQYGRTWAVMYDLSNQTSDVVKVVIEDWKQLIDKMEITNDKAYLYDKGKPIVAVWGIGFNDGRKYTLDECEELVDFLKNDKRYGNNTVMLGVPAGWRTLNHDSTTDEQLHRIISMADVISPWTVGRYASPQQARLHAKVIAQPDIEWLRRKKIDYLPVIFPGFSWQNRQKTHDRVVQLNQIPRLKGKFLWSQGIASLQEGANMLYVAMFDELDEGTAIFKCTNDPPVGESQFSTFEKLPTDHYLWLTGKLGEALRGECETTIEIPIRGIEQVGESG